MASEQTIDEILTDFTNFYERKQSPAQRMFYIHSLAQYDDDILCRAAMQLKRNERPNGFPVLATIDKYYQEERNAAWQRQKHNEPKRMNFDSVDRSERFEQFKRVFDGVGNIPKDEWLNLALESGVFTPVDVIQLKKTWEKMGAHSQNWVRREWIL